MLPSLNKNLTNPTGKFNMAGNASLIIDKSVPLNETSLSIEASNFAKPDLGYEIKDAPNSEVGP